MSGKKNEKPKEESKPKDQPKPKLVQADRDKMPPIGKGYVY